MKLYRILMDNGRDYYAIASSYRGALAALVAEAKESELSVTGLSIITEELLGLGEEKHD